MQNSHPCSPPPTHYDEWQSQGTRQLLLGDKISSQTQGLAGERAIQFSPCHTLLSVSWYSRFHARASATKRGASCACSLPQCGALLGPGPNLVKLAKLPSGPALPIGSVHSKFPKNQNVAQGHGRARAREREREMGQCKSPATFLHPTPAHHSPPPLPYFIW